MQTMLLAIAGVELLRNVAGLRLEINPTNLGFTKSCNRVAQLAKGDYLFFLNNDTLVCRDWLEPLLAVFDRFPGCGRGRLETAIS